MRDNAIEGGQLFIKIVALSTRVPYALLMFTRHHIVKLIPVKAWALVFLLVIGFVLYFAAATRSTVLYEVLSPDRRWIASVIQEECGFTIFSDPISSVVLRLNNGILSSFSSHKIFEGLVENPQSIPKIEWRQDGRLAVSISGLVTQEILLREERYQSIAIEYTFKELK